ncbi:MAG: hypothetical protein AAF414_03875, partial [Pseudomonadota bacterium]
RTGPGVFLMPQGWVSEAVIGSPTGLMEVEPGISRQYDAFMLNRHLVNLPPGKLVHELLTTPDAYMSARDVMPALYFLLSQRHWSAIASREHIDAGQAYIGDISWDGAPMPEA